MTGSEVDIAVTEVGLWVPEQPNGSRDKQRQPETTTKIDRKREREGKTARERERARQGKTEQNKNRDRG